MQYYFIINPVSGSGRGKIIWKQVESELDCLGVQYEAFRLTGRGEARKLAAALSAQSGESPCTITVVGGDGTINEVINGLTDFENIAFACIPTSSGNDFARGLGLERDPVKALHSILNPTKSVFINVGQARTDGGAPAFYAVSAGIGFDAAVCASVLESKAKKLLNRLHAGKVIYLATALWQLFTMKRHTFSISVDGAAARTCRDCYFVAAMNLPYEGGGFRFCPEADPGDDFIDLFVAHGISRLRVLTLLPLAFSGKHVGARGIEIIRCKKAEIKSPEPVCVHTDGEIPGYYDTVTFALRPEKLRVV